MLTHHGERYLRNSHERFISCSSNFEKARYYFFCLVHYRILLTLCIKMQRCITTSHNFYSKVSCFLSKAVKQKSDCECQLNQIWHILLSRQVSDAAVILWTDRSCLRQRGNVDTPGESHFIKDSNLQFHAQLESGISHLKTIWFFRRLEPGLELHYIWDLVCASFYSISLKKTGYQEFKFIFWLSCWQRQAWESK